MIPVICFYFEVHQPIRLKKFSVFSIGSSGNPFDLYFDHTLNQEIFERAARKCYIPTNRLLRDLACEFSDSFNVSFSMSGTFLECCEIFAPEVIESFHSLLDTGRADLLCETYYHSLAGLFNDLSEFEIQVRHHREVIKKEFNFDPVVFTNTETIYDNRIAEMIGRLGFQGIVAEGAEKILGWRSPNYLYRSVGPHSICVLTRNYRLSDDIAFRFSAHDWIEYPLTAEKFARWIASSDGELVNIFIDYETFGEHQWPETGIFEFLEHLPQEILRAPGGGFVTVSEAIKRFKPVGEIDVPTTISWADTQRDISTWLGNGMQIACFKELQEIGKTLKEKGDDDLLRIWRMLQTSDHLYYISTKGLADGTVHKYFSPYLSPYDAFINFMNILQDLKQRALRS